MATQLALLDRARTPDWDHTFCRLRRRELGEGAWIEHQPGWLRGHQALMDSLTASTRWRQPERQIYGDSVQVPRLVARVPDDGPGDPLLSELSHAFTRRYGRCLTAVRLALYRDCQDSVAMHADKLAEDRLDDSVVVILSLGVPRAFRLKPAGKGRSLGYTLGWGDLLVMGGSTQRHWLHGVPKVRRSTGPRMALMFREPRVDPPSTGAAG